MIEKVEESYKRSQMRKEKKERKKELDPQINARLQKLRIDYEAMLKAEHKAKILPHIYWLGNSVPVNLSKCKDKKKIKNYS